MSTKTIEVGSHVEFKESQWDVASIEKGWYGLTNHEGETAKARLKDLTLIELDNEDHNGNKMAGVLANYRAGYVPSIAASGKKSLSNGDAVAKALEGKAAEEVLQIADSLLGLPSGTLQSQYARLNPGQQRMNAGNRLRAAVKKGTIAVVDGELRGVAK
jgi:hypothetical protein